MMRTQGVRHAGSAVLDLCYVACGRVDGSWEFGLPPWDIAAGALIVTEAGGRVTNLEGGTLDLEARHMVAANRKHGADDRVIFDMGSSSALRRHPDIAQKLDALIEPICH